jgi:hypothetical protein
VGRDSPRFWSQRRGFVPPEGLTQTVFTENYIEKFDLKEKAIWVEQPVVIAATDPAWSSGGDRAVFIPAKVGRMRGGVVGIEFGDVHYINLELAAGEPMTYRLARKIIEYLKLYGITPEEWSCDITSAQRACADVVEREWLEKEGEMKHCHRVNFVGSASELPFSFEDETKCCDIFMNKVTELWYITREFARNGQLRGMEDQAIGEFCTREVMDKMDSRGRVKLESKTEMKSRTGGRSPDTADTETILVEHARIKLGISVGQGVKILQKEFSDDVMSNLDMESSMKGPLYAGDIFSPSIY